MLANEREAMCPNSEQTTSVRRLSRAPIRQSTIVRSNIDHTFGTFVRTITSWWPIQPFSTGKERVQTVTIEERDGGRIYETWDDGTVIAWGEILVWDPPVRFVMTWARTAIPTEVEFTFNALGPMLTRVTVEHRGWEALSAEQMEAACLRPGGYVQGWHYILACFAAATGPNGHAAPLDPH